MHKLVQFKKAPTAIGAGAIYYYDKAILQACNRIDAFDEPYSLAKVIGGEQSRIWVPRNMASGGEDLMVAGLDVVFTSTFKPRNKEQARIINESVHLLSQQKSHVVEAPTGMGKGACAMDIIACIGKKTLVVVTKEDIRDQWRNAAKKFLGLKSNEIGYIQGDTCSVVGRKLVIAMVQSMSKEGRYPNNTFKDFGLVVWDEVHRIGAEVFAQSCYRAPARLRLGLSATPTRRDGRDILIRAHIGDILVKAYNLPLIPKVIARRTSWKVPMTRVQGEIKPVPHSPGKCGHIINMLVNSYPRNRMICNFVGQAYKKGRCILVQSDRREHLRDLGVMLGGFGVPSRDVGYYLGGMKEKERKYAKTKRVIMATFSMTSEATDIPWLDTLVMTTPKSDVRQIVGRILRTYDNKKEPIVFDLVDFDSNVFAGYWRKRLAWYTSIKADIDRGT